MIHALFLLITISAYAYQKEPLHFVMSTDFLPINNCHNVTQGDIILEGSEYEAMNEIFSELNYTRNIDYDVSCVTWGELLSELKDPNSKIQGGITGFNQLSSYLDDYNMARFGTTPGGLSIMFKYEKSQSFIWKVVSLEMWLAFCVVIPVLLGIVVYLAEYPERRQYWVYYIYGIYNAILQTDDTRFFCFAPKMVLYSFKIFCMVFMMIYTSWLYTEVTREKTFDGVLSTHDLKGRKVMAWDLDNYVQLLEHYDATPITYTMASTLSDFLKEFREKTDVELLMIDSPIAAFLDKSSCDLFLALDTIFRFDYAPVFNKKTDGELVRLIELGTLKTVEKLGYNGLWNRYLASEKFVGCPGKQIIDSKRFHFADFRDLFVMVGVAMIAACIIEFYNSCILPRIQTRKRFRGVRRHKEEDLVSKMTLMMKQLLQKQSLHNLEHAKRFLQLNLKAITLLNKAKVEEIRRIVRKTR